VLQDLQTGAHVAVNAGGEQGDERLIVVQLRDFPKDQLIDVLRHLDGSAADRRGDLDHQVGDHGTIHVGLRHVMSLPRGLPEPAHPHQGRR
jgi:hypothetical protein